MPLTALLLRTVLPRCALLCLAAAGVAQAEVYTCVDARGQYLTSDRPILACLDREQRVLDSSGVMRRVIAPQMTSEERARHLASQQQAEEIRQRERDAVRRDQALVIRYPNQEAHDQARATALAQSQIVIDAADAQLGSLNKEREDLANQMAFFEKNPARAPVELRRKIEENAQTIEIQKQAIASQESERTRINARFDDELAHLRQLWSAAAAKQTAAQAPPGNP